MTAQKFTECLTKLKGIKASVFKSDKQTADVLSQQMIGFLRLNEQALSTSEKATLLMEFSQLKIFDFSSRDIIFKNSPKGMQVVAHPGNDIVSIAMLNVLNYLNQHDDSLFVDDLLQEANPAGLTIAQVLPKHRDSHYVNPHPNLQATFDNLKQTTQGRLAISMGDENAYQPKIPVLGDGCELQLTEDYYLAPLGAVNQTMNSIGSSPVSRENSKHPALDRNAAMELHDMHKILYADNAASKII